MLAKLSRNIGNYLAETLSLPRDSADIAAFALENIFHTVITLLTIGLAAGFLGLFWPAMIASFTAMLLRVFSGGSHASTPLRCLIISIVFSLSSGFLGCMTAKIITEQFFKETSYIFFLCSIALVIRYSPAQNDKKPIPDWQMKKYKICSTLSLIGWFIIIVYMNFSLTIKISSLLSALWQILSITPLGFQLSKNIEKGGDIMKKTVLGLLMTVLSLFAFASAASACSLYWYQPTVPECLRKK